MSNDQYNLISITLEYIKWLTKEIIPQWEVLKMCCGKDNWVGERTQCFKALNKANKYKKKLFR